MSENQQIIDASAAIATGKAATYAGSATAGLAAWIGTIDWGFWISISIAIGGFVMNWYYAKKKDRREALIAEQTLKKLQGQCNVKE